MGFMDIKEILANRQSNISSPQNRGIFVLLRWILAFLGFILIAGLLFPTAVGAILNFIWVTLLAIVVTFFTLGILVIVGLRQEASHILDILFEGSLTFLDLADFIRIVYRRFIEVLKEFLVFAAPVFAYVLTFVLYVLLLILYKWVGRSFDVAIFTIILTFLLVYLFGFFNRPKPDPAEEDLTWRDVFKKRFRGGFIDGFEIVLFVFFLTMDSTRVFFLPESLNVELKAKLGGYDLMVRSFIYTDHMKITVNLIIITIITEIFRNTMKVIAGARKHYISDRSFDETKVAAYSRSLRIKNAIRKSFNDAKDDLVKFITFTTVLFGAFMFFPRLKLLTLGVASVTNLFLDIILPERLTSQKSSDLLSRVIVKVFKL
ncbi:hypothetical protein C4561_05105 [candidate division WWE3 bacterium]|jgi:hypothetical protein|uniref:Uncharacterized protein n=1 Tax=candidate division WWE3 bacterium TaxID=2053526 RepID=A0A3A4ZI31_UNCKA|nr:MAG: hypothetical protein C4561_05105 [candidate division WWE3 bacterium]